MGGKSDRKARRQRRAAPARLKRRGRPGTAGLRPAATGLEGSDAHTACRSRLTPSRARCPHGDWRGRSPASCDRSALGRRDGAQRPVERSGIERGPCGMRGDARHRFMRTSPAMATLQRAVVRGASNQFHVGRKPCVLKSGGREHATIPDVGLPRWEPRRNRLAFHLRCIARIRLSDGLGQ